MFSFILYPNIVLTLGEGTGSHLGLFYLDWKTCLSNVYTILFVWRLFTSFALWRRPSRSKPFVFFIFSDKWPCLNKGFFLIHKQIFFLLRTRVPEIFPFFFFVQVSFFESTCVYLSLLWDKDSPWAHHYLFFALGAFLLLFFGNWLYETWENCF